MALYGLIGTPLSHSRSVELFSGIFRDQGLTDREYKLFPISDLDLLPDLMRDHPSLQGFNVTIPYKEKILSHLDELDETARQIGAVNTVLVSRKGETVRLKGFNTDADGFRDSIDFSGIKRALILGTGGASRAVAFTLRQAGIRYLFVSRNPVSPDTIPYSGITEDIMRSIGLIINTTPVGMYPDSASCPLIPYHRLMSSQILYDLVYNPPMTEFLKAGAVYGTHIQNGERMLRLQAEKSWKIWNDQAC